MVTKYICSIILHMTLQPRVHNALERLYYIKKHPHKFDRISIPMSICYFKLIVEIQTEITSLALTAACTDSKDVVMNYIALGVISQFDSVYYMAFKSPLKQQYVENNREIPITNFENIDVRKGLSLIDRMSFLSLKGLKFFYESLYFHLFPYLLFLLVFFNNYMVWQAQK